MSNGGAEQSGVIRLPADVRFGFGMRASIPGVVRSYGQRVFIVADPFLATTAEFSTTVASMRNSDMEVTVYTDVPPEIPVSAVETAAEVARKFGPDVFCGYGGGSALDAAKLVALLVAHGGDLSSFYGENAVPGPVLPLVAVPTTAGTGSEVTPVAVVADPQRALKVGISSPYLIPKVAIVDPELTVGAPRTVSAYAGIDAFVHAVESYTAGPLDIDVEKPFPVFIGRNTLTSQLSLHAAALIHTALPRVLTSPADRGARADMARGSLLAGMAFGSTGTHLSHAIQYPVGALTHTPHGLGTGTLLPFVLQACLPTIRVQLAEIGDAIGMKAGGDIDSRAQTAVDEIANLCARIGLPQGLGDLGIGASDRNQIIELTLQSQRLLAISPLRADRALIAAIVDAAIAGDREALVGLEPSPV